jgi:hypothetical protein
VRRTGAGLLVVVAAATLALGGCRGGATASAPSPAPSTAASPASTEQPTTGQRAAEQPAAADLDRVEATLDRLEREVAADGDR